MSGVPVARPPLHGIESIFCKAAMARSGSPRRAAIRARMSIDCGLFAASFSIGCKAMARSTSVKAATLSRRPAAISARSCKRENYRVYRKHERRGRTCSQDCEQARALRSPADRTAARRATQALRPRDRTTERPQPAVERSAAGDRRKASSTTLRSAGLRVTGYCKRTQAGPSDCQRQR